MFSSLMGWVDARFPATKMWEEHLSKYYAPKKLQLLVFLRFTSIARFGATDCHRHLPDNALQT